MVRHLIKFPLDNTHLVIIRPFLSYCVKSNSRILNSNVRKTTFEIVRASYMLLKCYLVKDDLGPIATHLSNIILLKTTFVMTKPIFV